MDDPRLKEKLEQHHSGSFAWALHCCSQDIQEAEEILQTVYLKILQGRARFNGRSAFKTWLFAVIRKTAAEFRRQHQFRVLKLHQYRSSVETSTFEEEGSSEVLDLFRTQLGKLPGRQQQLLELVFYHDLTLEESAKIMAISIGSARKHYDRGKKRIRQLMEESEAWHE